MAHVTNQWLLAGAFRDRRHWPVPVSAEVRNQTGDWEREHGVVASIRFVRADGDYKFVDLTSEDLHTIIPGLATKAEHEVQRRLAMKILHGFGDAELLAFLAELLPSRSADRI